MRMSQEDVSNLPLACRVCSRGPSTARRVGPRKTASIAAKIRSGPVLFEPDPSAQEPHPGPGPDRLRPRKNSELEYSSTKPCMYSCLRWAKDSMIH